MRSYVLILRFEAENQDEAEHIARELETCSDLADWQRVERLELIEGVDDAADLKGNEA